MNDSLLFPMRAVANSIDEAAILIDRACVQLANRKTQDVANIRGALEAHARLGQQDAKEPRPNRLVRQTQEARSRGKHRVALPGEFAIRKILPSARGIQSNHTAIVEVRMLNPNMFGVRFAPQNSHRVDRNGARE